jgi:hypothetical protein
MTIIAAERGYFVLMLSGEHVVADPVIAWVVHDDGRRAPVTAGENRTAPWTLEFPSGLVDAPTSTFATRVAWLEFLRAERPQAAARSTPEQA